MRSSKDRCAALTAQVAELKQAAKELEGKRTVEREGADKRMEQLREEMLQQRSEAKINEKSLEERLHARALDLERMRSDSNNKEIELRSEVKGMQAALEKARAECADVSQRAQSDMKNMGAEFRGREDKLQAQVLELTEKAAGCKRDLEAARAQVEALQGSVKQAQGASASLNAPPPPHVTHSCRHHRRQIQIVRGGAGSQQGGEARAQGGARQVARGNFCRASCGGRRKEEICG